MISPARVRPPVKEGAKATVRAGVPWGDKTSQLRRDLIRRGGCRMTLEEFREWLEAQRLGPTHGMRDGFFRCAYCRSPLLDAAITVDHDIAVKMGGSATRDNLRICCGSCNRRKGHMSGTGYRLLVKFMEENLAVYEMSYVFQKLGQKPVWRQGKRS